MNYAKYVNIDENVPYEIVEDIHWVLRQGVGQKLAEQALEQHGKPINITWDQTLESCYTDIHCKHTVNLNQEDFEDVYIDVNKEEQPWTAKQIIAHEFRHAAQPQLVNMNEEELLQKAEQLMNEFWEDNADEMQAGAEELNKIKEIAREAESREEAEVIIRKFYQDAYTGEDMLASMKKVDYIRYISDEIEAEAITTENEILKILDKPARHPEYYINLAQNIDNMKEFAVQCVADELFGRKKQFNLTDHIPDTSIQDAENQSKINEIAERLNR